MNAGDETNRQNEAANTAREDVARANSAGGGFFRELLQFAIIALVVVVPVRVYVAQPYIVSGESMHPTFANGEYLIVDQLSYRLRDPSRGEVAIFRYPADPSKFFIKRVIGMPGDSVHIQEGAVDIRTGTGTDAYRTLEEPYIAAQTPGGLRIELEENEYFLMGDNRIASLDSRTFGPVPRELMVGRVFLRLLPPQHFSYLPGFYMPLAPEA